jgi:type IV secretion system protein VirB1
MDLIPIIEKCAPTVAPQTLQRIIGVESGQRPHAIGYKVTKNGTVYTLTKQPSDTKEAQAWADWLYQNGYKFDAGIAQVNSANFMRLGLTPRNVFDPCVNIGAGGKILTEFYTSASSKFGPGQTALFAAISAYQSGNFKTGFQTGYVQKVTGSPPASNSLPPLVLASRQSVKPKSNVSKKFPVLENPYDSEIEAKVR